MSLLNFTSEAITEVSSYTRNSYLAVLSIYNALINNASSIFSSYSVTWAYEDDHSRGITEAYLNIASYNSKLKLSSCTDSSPSYGVKFNLNKDGTDFRSNMSITQSTSNYYADYTSGISFLVYTNGNNFVINRVGTNAKNYAFMSVSRNEAYEVYALAYTGSSTYYDIIKIDATTADTCGFFGLKSNRLCLDNSIPIFNAYMYKGNNLCEYSHIQNTYYAYPSNIGSPANLSTIDIGGKHYVVMYSSDGLLFEYIL